MHKDANKEAIQKEMLPLERRKHSIPSLQTLLRTLQLTNLPHLEQGSVRTLELV